MDNLQKEFSKLIQQIDNSHFHSDSQAQIFYFKTFGQVKNSIKFKEFQECEYIEARKRIDYQYDLNGTEISPDQTLLVSISFKTIYIWDFLKNSQISEYQIKNCIRTFTFIYPTNNIIFGDNKGMIHQIFIKDDNFNYLEGFEVHEDQIYFIIIKQQNEIFTCSKDNTIKLTNIEQKLVLLTIEYICSCECNFLYVEMENILIVPNGQNLSVYNSQNGLQINRTHYGKADTFLQLLLSNNCENLYMNLPCKFEINIYQVDCQAKQIRLNQIIKLTSFCYNLSLCFSDDILVILNDIGFELLHLSDDLPLIKKIYSQGTSEFFFNRQHPKLNKLLSMGYTEVIINERRS